MSKMKLGTKIAMGFGILIVISLLLGGMAVYQMGTVSSESDKLAHEYVPEVAVANEVERYSLLTMYAMRGYALSEEEAYLTEGRKRLGEVSAALDKARALAEKAVHLEKLKGQVDAATTAVKEYSELAEQTVNKNQAIAENRLAMNKAAETFMTNCSEFLGTQNEAMKKEFGEGAEVYKLEERLGKINTVNDIIDLGNAVRLAAWKSQAQRDPKVIQDALPLFEAMNKKFEELKAVTKQAVNLKQIDNTKAAAEEYKKGMTDLLNNWLALQEVGAKRTTTAQKVLDAAQTTSAAGIENTASIANNAASSLSSASTMMVVGLLVALAAGCLLAFFITRSITVPVRRIIDSLSSGADQVSSAAGQVSSASQSLAEGASEQAAAVEETSSSLEEMSSMTKQNADSAVQANSLMTQTKSAVQKANTSMKQVTQAMAEISSVGQEIGKIIKTIDEIAFQTNLLALNAAVEAARAGEAGAGFAVVADEVRNLAMRAADAAKNTSNLIETTINRISQGTELVKTTDEAFSEVADNSNKVGELVGEIAAASSEQAQGIDQINQAVAQMDSITQTNAANAEESASASEELSAQSETLLDVVGELTAMVGGAGAGNGSRHNGNGHAKSTTRRQTAVQALPRSSNVKKAARTKVPQIAKAEDVIPMDDDFNEF
jgi:methyl-accepting chemotaxis protein